jgi:S-adenosylmethionine hydrolase
MAIITLTSDWGTTGHYTGAVKGAILRQVPECTIVDISHNIPSFNLNQAAFIIRNFYKNFPKGTIHIIGLNEEATLESPHTVVVYDDHYFIGADNGIFSLIFDAEPQSIIEIDIIQDSDYFTFPSRDVFVKAAAHIVKGMPIEDLGHPRKNILQKIALQPVTNGNIIKGNVIFIDNYENAITNITERLFREIVKNRRFIISFRSTGYRISHLSRSYQDVPEGEMLALFSTSGHLEIAMNKGRASSLLGLKLDTSVVVEIE